MAKPGPQKINRYGIDFKLQAMLMSLPLGQGDLRCLFKAPFLIVEGQEPSSRAAAQVQVLRVAEPSYEGSTSP